MPDVIIFCITVKQQLDMDKEIKNLLNFEQEHLTRLKTIVSKTIEDEQLIIDNLLHPPKDVLTKGQRISDRIARFGGSWAFIISFFVLIIGWILFNTLAPKQNDFDPYPFILMNLVLSCLAALQAPIIMMSQNRQEEKDRQRSQNDYLINMKAELEIRSLHQKMDLLLEGQLKTIYDIQLKQLEMLKRIAEKLEKK
ncbi:MAG: DUF1003 domain-containing protein [Agriterribacter sp.]